VLRASHPGVSSYLSPGLPARWGVYDGYVDHASGVHGMVYPGWYTRHIPPCIYPPWYPGHIPPRVHLPTYTWGYIPGHTGRYSTYREATGHTGRYSTYREAYTRVCTPMHHPGYVPPYAPSRVYTCHTPGYTPVTPSYPGLYPGLGENSAQSGLLSMGEVRELCAKWALFFGRVRRELCAEWSLFFMSERREWCADSSCSLGESGSNEA